MTSRLLENSKAAYSETRRGAAEIEQPLFLQESFTHGCVESWSWPSSTASIPGFMLLGNHHFNQPSFLSERSIYLILEPGASHTHISCGITGNSGSAALETGFAICTLETEAAVA